MNHEKHTMTKLKIQDDHCKITTILKMWNMNIYMGVRKIWSLAWLRDRIMVEFLKLGLRYFSVIRKLYFIFRPIIFQMIIITHSPYQEHFCV